MSSYFKLMEVTFICAFITYGLVADVVVLDARSQSMLNVGYMYHTLNPKELIDERVTD